MVGQGLQGQFSEALSISASLRPDARRAFDDAKRWWRYVLVSDFGLLAVGIASALAAEGARNVLAFASLVLFALSWGIKQVAGARYARGEAIRRLLFVGDSLNRKPTAQEGLDLSLTMEVNPAESPYYASVSPPGLKRLSENLAESSFFTRRLAAHSMNFMLGIFAVFAVFAILALWISLSALSTTGGSSPAFANLMARIFPPVVSAVATGHMLNDGLALRQLATTAKTVGDRALEQASPSSSTTEADAILLLGMYEWSLARCVPIPEIVHRLFAQRVHEEWIRHGRIQLPSVAESLGDDRVAQRLA
jgi:hypothetical protein